MWERESNALNFCDDIRAMKIEFNRKNNPARKDVKTMLEAF